MTFLLMYQETVLAVLNDKAVNNLEKAEKVFAANYFATMLAHNHDELKSEEIDEESESDEADESEEVGSKPAPKIEKFKIKANGVANNQDSNRQGIFVRSILTLLCKLAFIVIHPNIDDFLNKAR